MALVSTAKRKKKKCIMCKNSNNAPQFSFPQDPDLRQLWAEFCEMKVQHIRKSYKLCAEHFLPTNFQRYGQTMMGKELPIKKRLIPAAVPSIYILDDLEEISDCSDSSALPEKEVIPGKVSSVWTATPHLTEECVMQQ